MSNKVDPQVQFALNYVKENKYAYGPAYSSKNLVWNVDKIEESDSGITRIYINYKVSEESKNYGSEYIDIDQENNILSRRQIKILKDPKPVVLMVLTFVSIVIAALSIPIMIFDPFSGDKLYVGGRTLWLRSEEPKTLDYILYEASDTKGDMYFWEIMPDDMDSNNLALVEITISNQKSNTVNLNIDYESSELHTEDAKYKPLNIIQRAEAKTNDDFSKTNTIENFIPMWGKVVLNRGEQIRGYIVFEVKKNSDYKQFRWKTADTIIVNY